jgi:nucleotide-binding universal stress UspA family protein
MISRLVKRTFQATGDPPVSQEPPEGSAEGETSKDSESRHEFKRLLVAVDGSANASRAARVAVNIAKKFRAELIVCHVIATPIYSSVQPTALTEYFESAKDHAKKLIGEVLRMAEADHVTAHELIIENAFSVVEAIVKNAAGRNVDLIVIGTRGLTGLRKLLIGSVSSGVLNHAHSSVLMVR